jgi:hypothetical protein
VLLLDERLQLPDLALLPQQVVLALLAGGLLLDDGGPERLDLLVALGDVAALRLDGEQLLLELGVDLRQLVLGLLEPLGALLLERALLLEDLLRLDELLLLRLEPVLELLAQTLALLQLLLEPVELALGLERPPGASASPRRAWTSCPRARSRPRAGASRAPCGRRPPSRAAP